MELLRKRKKTGGADVDFGRRSFALHRHCLIAILLILLSFFADSVCTEAQSADWGIMTARSKEYRSSDVPKGIPGKGTETSTLTIADAGPIVDLNVKLNITHPYASDLDVFLIAPDGTRVELFTDVGGTSANFQETILDDEASQSITDGEGPFAGSYRPEGSLAALDTKSITGTWTLEATDDWGVSRAGTLNSWSLIIELEVQRPPGAKYDGGTGEPNDPYQIATVADLIALGETPEDYNKCFILTADIDLDPNLSGGRVFDKAVIAPDIDPAKADYQGTSFAGVFDGNGQTISHLTITGGEYIGLFGRLASGAEVRGLGVQAVNITAPASRVYIGGLVGSNGGTVTRCCSTGVVSGGQAVGGLVGINEWGHVIQCYSTAAVSGRGECVGGLVGSNGDWRSGGLVTQSYSTGAVTGGFIVGGLVGASEGDVTYCYSTGAVRGERDFGGLLGFKGLSGTVTGCFWDKQTSGQTRSAGGAGKTTAEMQTAGTFLNAGWDFVNETANGTEDIWRIDEGRDYPRLQWEPVGTPPPPPPAEGKVIELTEETFDQIVLGSNIPVLVDFGAPWCPPCRLMDPVIEEIAKEYAGRAKVCKINTDNAPNICRRYDIMYIPTFILFKDGKIQLCWIGVTPKEDLTDGIDSLL